MKRKYEKEQEELWQELAAWSVEVASTVSIYAGYIHDLSMEEEVNIAEWRAKFEALTSRWFAFEQKATRIRQKRLVAIRRNESRKRN